jgi:hypothetical protein
MTERHERIRQEWLAKIAAHPKTTDADYAAAETILRDDRLTDDDVDVSNLVRLGFVFVNPNGTHAALIPF